jgi:hypothetical protein
MRALGGVGFNNMLGCSTLSASSGWPTVENLVEFVLYRGHSDGITSRLECRHLSKTRKTNSPHIDNGGRLSLEATPFVAIIRMNILSTTQICTKLQRSLYLCRAAPAAPVSPGVADPVVGHLRTRQECKWRTI